MHIFWRTSESYAPVRLYWGGTALSLTRPHLTAIGVFDSPASSKNLPSTFSYPPMPLRTPWDRPFYNMHVWIESTHLTCSISSYRLLMTCQICFYWLVIHSALLLYICVFMCDYCVVYFFYSVCNTDASDACAINSLFYKIVIVEHYLYNFAFIFVSMIVFPLNLMKRVEIPSALWAAALVAMPSIPRKIMMSRLCRDATQLINGLWLIALQFQ